MPLLPGPVTVTAGGGVAAVPAASTVGDNSANFTTTSASFVDLTAATVSIAAAVGDTLHYSFIATFHSSANGVNNFFLLTTTTGAHTIDSQQWTAVTLSQQYPAPLIAHYTVVSGDISGGLVAAKVRVASDGSNTLTVHNSGSIVWRLSVMNLLH